MVNFKLKLVTGLEWKKPRTPNDKEKMNINLPRKLTENECEESVRLRAKNEYIKAENEIIKNL